MSIILFDETRHEVSSDLTRIDFARLQPREDMSQRIPDFLQPFITWLTAKPSSREAYRVRTAFHHLWTSLLLAGGGAALSVTALIFFSGPISVMQLAAGLILTTSGLGKLQAVIYHHCAHGTVFRSRATNRIVGCAIGIFLLVKNFDNYQKEHMLHHNPKKLLTHEDEFAEFVFKLCGLGVGLPKAALWRRVLLSFVSPFFHMRFLMGRLSSCLLSRSPVHNMIALAYWGALFFAIDQADMWSVFIVAWLVPVVVLFQLATALRVLCEHRFPHESIIGMRDKRFVGMATAGVFAGSAPPVQSADTYEGFVEWAVWWGKMLTVHLFERVFVLVGDAPAHDFHHRHPASRKWSSYIHAREADRQAGCPSYPVNYIEDWGLFRAIDENLMSMSEAR